MHYKKVKSKMSLLSLKIKNKNKGNRSEDAIYSDVGGL